LITGFGIVYGQGDARCIFIFIGHGFAQVGCEGCDPTLAREVITNKSDALDSPMDDPIHFQLSFQISLIFGLVPIKKCSEAIAGLPPLPQPER
jgi:hypothetical protein